MDHGDATSAATSLFDCSSLQAWRFPGCCYSHSQWSKKKAEDVVQGEFLHIAVEIHKIQEQQCSRLGMSYQIKPSFQWICWKTPHYSRSVMVLEKDFRNWITYQSREVMGLRRRTVEISDHQTEAGLALPLEASWTSQQLINEDVIETAEKSTAHILIIEMIK